MSPIRMSKLESAVRIVLEFNNAFHRHEQQVDYDTSLRILVTNLRNRVPLLRIMDTNLRKQDTNLRI